MKKTFAHSMEKFLKMNFSPISSLLIGITRNYPLCAYFLDTTLVQACSGMGLQFGCLRL